MSIRRDSRPEWRAATRLVHGGQRRSDFNETAEALYLTSGYVYESAAEAESAFDNSRPRFVYSRFGNPTVAMFEERMAELEGAEAARATASGMAAAFAVLACQLKAGDRVVASDALFGSCQFILAEILPKWGIETVFVDGRDLDAWAMALAKPTQVVFVETPSNPALRLIDLAAVGDLAHRAGARFIVDNVFATPIQQKPLQFGADIVFYSATKHIDGQGRTLGGIILGKQNFITDILQPFLRHTGPSLSPFNAWLLLKGLETLELRVRRMSETAEAIAQALLGHPKLAALLYPTLPDHPQIELARRQMSGGGSMLALDLKGGKAAAFRFLDSLRLVLISNNLGDAKTLATHPATTTHQRLAPELRQRQGIGEGMVRLSIGLEDRHDLIADILAALDPA